MDTPTQPLGDIMVIVRDVDQVSRSIGCHCYGEESECANVPFVEVRLSRRGQTLESAANGLRDIADKLPQLAEQFRQREEQRNSIINGTVRQLIGLLRRAAHDVDDEKLIVERVARAVLGSADADEEPIPF